jgi:hypothetical protein
MHGDEKCTQNLVVKPGGFFPFFIKEWRGILFTAFMAFPVTFQADLTTS